MTSLAHPVYTPDEQTKPTIHLRYRDDLRFWSDENLKDHLSFLQRERAFHLVEDTDLTPGNVAWCELRMDEVLTELERRKSLARRLRKDPRGPRWSNAGKQDRDDIISLAQDLKSAWPIDRFLIELMMARLEPSGRGRWRTQCLAPDHRDEHPSMVVYGDDNHVYCFTCGFHGDVIDLTKLHFNTDSFREAVRRLADATSSMHGKVVA